MIQIGPFEFCESCESTGYETAYGYHLPMETKSAACPADFQVLQRWRMASRRQSPALQAARTRQLVQRLRGSIVRQEERSTGLVACQAAAAS